MVSLVFQMVYLLWIPLFMPVRLNRVYGSSRAN